MTEPSNDASHFRQLLGYLDYDPDNLQLMADAASAAVDEGDSAAASGLIDRYAAQAPLPPAMLNLKGIIAMSEGRFEEAAASFAGLRAGGADAPALRFNHAWALTMAKDYEPALALLDDDAVSAGPRGRRSRSSCSTSSNGSKRRSNSAPPRPSSIRTIRA